MLLLLPVCYLFIDVRISSYSLLSYFCGHDHSLQYINDTNVNYFVCGAGHRSEDSESHLVIGKE